MVLTTRRRGYELTLSIFAYLTGPRLLTKQKSMMRSVLDPSWGWHPDYSSEALIFFLFLLPHRLPKKGITS